MQEVALWNTSARIEKPPQATLLSELKVVGQATDKGLAHFFMEMMKKAECYKK